MPDAAAYHRAMMGLRLASQRVMARAAGELAEGSDTWFISLGTSMSPAVKAVQRVRLRPVREGERLAGRVVLSRVGARYWLHRVMQERPGEALIAADTGMVNGWTPRALVFGVVAPGAIGERDNESAA